jgi:hypothetical protein
LSLLLVSLIFTSCQTGKLNQSGLSKINEYDEAANFLMIVADQEKGLSETCGISSSEALSLLQPLHAMIDEEIGKGPYSLTVDQVANCEAQCHCGVYSDLEKKNSNKDTLYVKAKNIPKKSLISCAQKTANSFCSSNLLKTLNSEVSAAGISPPNGL